MSPATAFSTALHYPPARRDDSVVDDYFGVQVPDPYRWLEDPDSEETKEFVENQVKLTDAILGECELIGKLKEKITEGVNFPRHGVPFRRGEKYFHFYNTGLQPQNVFCVKDDLDGKSEELIDPSLLEFGGGASGLHEYSITEDGKYLAFGLSSKGNDWLTIKVMKIEDRSIGPDCLSWVRFGGLRWTHDNKGFFYCRYPPLIEGEYAGTENSSSSNQEVRYHFLGTDQSEDILCWRDPENPNHYFKPEITDDGKYLLLNTSKDCDPVSKVYYLDLTSLPNGLEGFRGGNQLLPFVKLVDNFDASYGYVINDGSVFTFLTNKDAPRYKLVRVDLKNPDRWTDVIPESEKDVLESAHAVNRNQLLVRYLSDVKHVLEIRDLETGSLLHHLPVDIGAVDGISAQREDSFVFFKLTSFLTPGIIYKCDLKGDTPQMKIFKECVVPDFDRSEFEVNQVFVPSKDGKVKLPMFIVGRKGIALDGSHPCLLTGYGGFNISIKPSFSVSRIVILKHLGALFCSSNIRGGGEYGEEWHKAGWLANKQNVFDDFASVSEYLISEGYTQPKKLCIEGGSNGGLLVGTCINQRPDLFGCAIANCGVQDMLRFHKFTLGYAWTSDYGCSDKEEDFHWLIKYSPVHNVKRPWEQPGNHQVQYPATMILTADHDDRVVPLHSLKLLATLQYVLCTSLENTPQKNPLIGRIASKAGHYGRPTMRQIDEAAEKFGFMAKAIEASWTD